MHALGSDGLIDPAITLVSARSDGRLLGVGALRPLGDGHAEIKSMHTSADARGRGVGTAIVTELLSIARRTGCRRVSLETGVMHAFAPARSLYASLGFVPCEPFGDYRGSVTSACMTIDLGADVRDPGSGPSARRTPRR